MQDCKAAKFNGGFACIAKCKWPGVCPSGAATPTTKSWEAPQVETPADVNPEAPEGVADIEIPAKPRRGRKPREDA